MRLGVPVASLPALLSLAAAAGTGVGQVTWLHPQPDGCFAVESSVPGVSVRVEAVDGTLVADAEALAAAGWRYAEGGLWESPRRSGGNRLRVTVSGLPAGSHRVYVWYFAQARLPGNTWWFRLQAGVEPGNAVWLDETAERIVRGTGGHDLSTLYEARIGTVGSSEQPVDQASFWVQRYEWSELARIGSIRIESAPSMHACFTGAHTPENRRIREALLANGPGGAGNAAYGVGVVSGTLKVRPKTFADLAEHPPASQIEMAAARGEYESRQVVIFSPDRDLVGVDLECSPLGDGNGASIPAGELLFAPVGYCPYDVPSNPSVHGYWPEPILTFLDTFKVRRGDVQSLWYRVHVPRDARAGVYGGTVTIRPGDAPACTIPVTLRVWDFELPTWPRLRVVVGCNQPGEFEMSYGLNPSSIYGFRDEWIEQFPGWGAADVNALSLGYINPAALDGETKMPTEEQLDEWVAEIGKRYRAATAAGLRETCYVYMFDEAKREWDPAMRRISERLRKEFPELLLLTTAHRPWYAGGGVDDGGTNPTIDAINGWCPLTMHYNRDQASAARGHGRQVWWYTCNSPPKPFANLMMTHPAMDARLLMGFMAYAYQTNGFLYYATAGGYYANMPAITAGPYTKWNIVDNAHNHLYQKGPDGPLPSLRLEAIRDGLEDYDYLALGAEFCDALDAAGANGPELNALRRELGHYAAPGNDVVESLTKYSEDPALLETVRRRLGHALEAAQQRLTQER